MNRLSRFAGGIRLPGFKVLSRPSRILSVPLPPRLVLPLRQHSGAPAEAVVEVGERVLKGQLIASACGRISAPVHASSSGVVTAIEKRRTAHQSGIAETCIVIDTDGEDRWGAVLPPLDDGCDDQSLRARIRDAGIVGLGGAVFPSAAKLSPQRPVEVLLLNGAECEPYISCDDALMRARPDAILRGALLLDRLLTPARRVIAVEDNKPDAIKALNQTLGAQGLADRIEVVAVPTRFPAGGEKQLIKVVTGREVPPGGLPAEVAVVCLNVATAAAVADAVQHGRPLVSRVTTVTGPAVRRPGNYRVPLGMPVADLLAAAGGVSEAHHLVMGGPMMGSRLPDAEVPIVKASNCILVDAPPRPSAAIPCIRCGRCAEVCPIKLLPQQLYWHARAKDGDKLEHHHLDSCIECGCCAVVCPSHIPLVQYFRFAKGELREQRARAQFAEQSRERTRQREARVERERIEQEQRRARRKAQRAAKPARAKAPPASASAPASAPASIPASD